MSSYTMLWIFWLAMFVAIEAPAVFNKPHGDTFSEHIWRWFSIGVKSRGWQLRRLVLLVFLAWLVTHFLTRGAV